VKWDTGRSARFKERQCASQVPYERQLFLGLASEAMVNEKEVFSSMCQRRSQGCARGTASSL
jgi:hypothetical protein